MKVRKRLKWWQITLIVLAAVGLLIGGGIWLISSRLRSYEEQLNLQNKTGVVTKGDITTTVYGSGTISAADTVAVQNELTAKVKTVNFRNGDAVQEGDCIALLEDTGLEDAIDTARDTLQQLEDGLAALPVSGASTLYAPASARVKAVYAVVGDSVEAVQSLHGCLAMLSLDGYMAVTVATDALAPGDTVTVNLGTGNQEGLVTEAADGEAVILTDDAIWDPGAEVSVTYGGRRIGSGTLEIHRPYPVKGTTGTIRSVPAGNASVSAGTGLFRLEGKILSAQLLSQYESIADAREALEELEADREKLTITAPVGGILCNLTLTEGAYAQKDTIAAQIASGGMELRVDVDELDILSVSPGLNATVEFSALENTTLDATVVRIDRSGVSAGGVTTYGVTLRIQTDDRLYLGMTADAEICTGSVQDTLLVPVEAVITRDGQKYLSIPGEDTTAETLLPITIGLVNDTYAQILTGAEEGQEVYLTKADTNDFFAMFQSMRNSMVTGDAS